MRKLKAHRDQVNFPFDIRNDPPEIVSHKEGSMDGRIANAELAELLASAAENAKGQLQRAFRRAARLAFLWPEEAVDLLRQNRSLTELAGIGPYLARQLEGWIENPPDPLPEPPPIRRSFLTLSSARNLLQTQPDWAARLRGDLQMHSTWSDGSGSIAGMADAGEARGYEYIAITDHTKGLKIAGGIDEARLLEQAREIQAVNAALAGKSSPLRVLRSAEVNLNPAGQSDMEPDSLKGLDIVLGSFHSALRKTDDQTERYLAALRNPDIQILGHPRGRIYNFRLGLKADWEKVFAEAARLNKAVEIDCYPDRQDLDLTLVELAREAGTFISFGSDAHHPWQLIFLDLALAAALRAGVPPDRIVNFKSRDALLAWVQEVRGGPIAKTKKPRRSKAGASSRPVSARAR